MSFNNDIWLNIATPINLFNVAWWNDEVSLKLQVKLSKTNRKFCQKLEGINLPLCSYFKKND